MLTKLFKLVSYAKRNAYLNLPDTFCSVYLQETQIETMLLAEEEERLKNNLLDPSNIVETSNRLADTRGTRTASNQDKVVKLLSDTGCIKTSPKEYSMGLVLTGESIFSSRRNQEDLQ